MRRITKAGYLVRETLIIDCETADDESRDAVEDGENVLSWSWVGT